MRSHCVVMTPPRATTPFLRQHSTRWQGRPAIDTDVYRQLIENAFPEVKVRELSFLGAGWDSVTVLVNGELVFRFPQRDDVARTLEVERCLLPRLAALLPLPIPHFDLVGGPFPGYPWHFVGYHALPGRPMAELPAACVHPDQVGPALGPFLRALHDAPVELAERCGAPCYTPDSWVEHHWRLAQEILPLVERSLGATRARRFLDLWEAYRRDPRYRQFTPAIVHADLNPDHVLLDPATGEVTGIIDFGDVCVGDPAIDFAGLPDDIVEAMLATYGRHDPTLLYRRQALIRAIPLHAVHFGATFGDEAIVSAGLDELSRELDR